MPTDETDVEFDAMKAILELNLNMAEMVIGTAITSIRKIMPEADVTILVRGPDDKDGKPRELIGTTDTIDQIMAALLRIAEDDPSGRERKV
jgi:hypothetical protein